VQFLARWERLVQGPAGPPTPIRESARSIRRGRRRQRRVRWEIYNNKPTPRSTSAATRVAWIGNNRGNHKHARAGRWNTTGCRTTRITLREQRAPAGYFGGPTQEILLTHRINRRRWHGARGQSCVIVEPRPAGVPAHYIKGGNGPLAASFLAFGATDRSYENGSPRCGGAVVLQDTGRPKNASNGLSSFIARATRRAFRVAVLPRASIDSIGAGQMTGAVAETLSIRNSWCWNDGDASDARQAGGACHRRPSRLAP